MSCSAEEEEHVESVLRRALGAAWAHAAEVVRIVRVRRVTLEEQTGAMRRELIWEGPEPITSRLEGVELLPAQATLATRVLCLDVMSESLQRRASATMEAWAKTSSCYPIVSVQLATEEVAEVRLRGSRRRVLIGMRTARVLSIHEPQNVALGALLGGVGGLGVASGLVVLGQSLPTAALAAVTVTLAVLLAEAMHRPRSLATPRSR